MKKYVSRLCFFFCLCSSVMISCEKETSEDPVDPKAIFNLIVSDSACAAVVLNGQFFEGKLLTAVQNLQLPVYISKTGKWSFSTDTINGFSFAGNGEFIDTGKQMITLNASGIPSSAGTMFFSVTTGSTKQLIPVSVIKDNITPETVPLRSYFHVTIAGVKYYVESPIIGPDNIPYSGGGGKDTASLGSAVGPGIYPNPPGTGTISLQKDFLYGFLSCTEADFKKFFQPGSYPYRATLCGHVLPGVTIFWNDSNNQIWTTQKEFGDQGGSYFTITGIEDGHDSDGIYFVKVRSRFRCKLYGLRTSQMIELTDGEMVSYFKFNRR